MSGELQVKYTGLYDPDQKPARVGVYQRHLHDGHFMWSKWDGNRWLRMYRSPELADKATKASGRQRLRWRGLDQEVKP